MPKTRKIQTNFTKGELSPLIEGQTNLAAYFEGGRTVENFLIQRQGGMTRWPGSRYIAEVKDSSKDTILWPFEFSVDDAYILEIGDQYLRVYRDKAQVLSMGSPVEIATPFAVADIRSIHFTQSADVLFVFHGSYQQRVLSRVSDTSWTLTTFTASPPPSFEDDTDLGDTLAPEANTGTSIQFRAGSGIFLASDVGRQIVSGSSRAVITTFTDSTEVVADILDDFNQSITAGPATLSSVGTTVTSTAHGAAAGDFVQVTSGAQAGQMREIASITDPDTFELVSAFSVDQTTQNWNKIVPIANGSWALRLSPQTTLDPNIKEPVGAQVTLVAGADAFRTTDVGKYIAVYGGLIKITVRDSVTQVRGTLLSEMTETNDANPSAAPAGAWTLETASWSATEGWPRTGEFFQGRLYQASTSSQPTTFWGSRSDDFYNYAIGSTDEDAVEYTMASRKVNRIEWLTENSQALFLGTTGSEHKAVGSGSDNALIGGTTIPSIERLSTNGCQPIQPIVSRRTIIYSDRSTRKIMAMAYDVDSAGEVDKELSVGSEHVTGSGVRLGPIAYQRRLDPRLYFVTEEGVLVCMTYYPEQKVVAFSRRMTDGTFESVAVIPDANGGNDQVWVIVKRTINGSTKRYVELFEDRHEDLSTRAWTSLQTDCALVYNGASTTTITGLTYLEGETVQIVADGNDAGTAVVSGGQITIPEAATVVEVGVSYTSTYESFRPAVEQNVLDGLPRSWDTLWLRVVDSLGGSVNGEPIQFAPAALGTPTLYSGDYKVTGQGWGTDGRITITQSQPYPLTVLAAFGTLAVGDHD